MLKLKLLEYYSFHSSELKRTYRVVSDSLEEEALHNMRLSVKRLRVFFAFFAPLEEKTLRSAEFLKEASRVFRHAGRLRDLQVQQGLVRRQELELGLPFPEYHAHLQAGMSLHQTRLLKQMSKDKLIPRLTRKSIVEAALAKHTEASLLQSYREHMRITYDQFSAHYASWEKSRAADDLHRARRYLKQVMYLMNMATLSRARIRQRIFTTISLKRIEQAIGKWHDLDVGVVQLQSFINESPLPANRIDTYRILLDNMEKDLKKGLKKAARGAAGPIVS